MRSNITSICSALSVAAATLFSGCASPSPRPHGPPPECVFSYVGQDRILISNKFSTDERTNINTALTQIQRKLPRAFSVLELVVVKHAFNRRTIEGQAQVNRSYVEQLLVEEEYQPLMGTINDDILRCKNQTKDYVLLAPMESTFTSVRQKLIEDKRYQSTVIHEIGHLLAGNDRNCNRTLEHLFETINRSIPTGTAGYVSGYANEQQYYENIDKQWEWFSENLDKAETIYFDKQVATLPPEQAQKILEHEIHPLVKGTQLFDRIIAVYHDIKQEGIKGAPKLKFYISTFPNHLLFAKLQVWRQYSEKIERDLSNMSKSPACEDIAETFEYWISEKTHCNRDPFVQEKLKALQSELNKLYGNP